MKVWEKSYLYTLILFVLIFFICIFIIYYSSFSAVLSAERDAAMNEAYFISQAVSSDISALENRKVDSNQALQNVFSAYAKHYKRFGIYLALLRDTDTIYSSNNVNIDDFVYNNAMICMTESVDAHKYIHITNALQETQSHFSIIYLKNIDAVYSRENNHTVFLIILSVCVSVILASVLYFTLQRLYRPLNNLAHELRTPLTSIQGYAEYLQIATLSEEERYTATQYIIDESRCLGDITNNLLIMASLRDGTIARRKIDITAIFESAKMTYNRVEYHIQQRNFLCDQALIQSLVNNLVSNAIKASKDEQIIILRAYNNTIEVSDKGKGMSANILSRANNPSAISKGGSGLGIPLCHQIAKLHDAKIIFKSSQGRGTTVKLIFTTP